MSKRKNGDGSWDTITRKGNTYKRYRIEGKEFTAKTEKECKAKYLAWKKGQKTNLKDKKTTVLQVSIDWLASKRKHIKASTYDGYEYFVTDILGKEKEHVFISTEDRKKLEHEEQRLYSNGVRVYGNNAKMIIFLLHTGLRFGELTALTWQHVDFNEKKIFIKDNSPIIKNRDSSVDKAYVLDTTSTKRKASNRFVPLSNKALDILTYFYNNYPHENANLVFVSETGTPANRRNVARTIKNMLKASNCEVQDASPMICGIASDQNSYYAASILK